MNKIEIINASDVANAISSLVDHVASLSEKDKEWFSKVYFREVIKSQHYVVQSQDELATHVNYDGTSELTANARYIVDWLAGLQERDPKQHGKLSRITFQQALGHSKKWHAELAKKAEQSDRYIEPDTENAPKVLDLGDGWEVFWLKTKKAREAEGEVMGHCVGSGVYDELDDGEAVFSIRKNNVAHITLHLYTLKVEQAVTKGNEDVPERYQYLVDAATENLCKRLLDVKETRNDKGDLHRLDGPASYSEFRPEKWYKNGDRHRLDGPAVIQPNGNKIWYKNDKLHREDGPAVIREDNTQEWYREGKLHRLDGPAVINRDGSQEWYQENKRHREDGPAVIDVDGTQEWYKNNNLHRLDKPAIIHADGTQFWYKDGKLHREDGPAVIKSDGTQEWYKNNKIHREDGPAIIKASGTQEWWMDGKHHRNDEPAVIYASGRKEWWVDGKCHRLDGPAVIHPDGSQEWRIDGRKYSEKEFNDIIKNATTSPIQSC